MARILRLASTARPVTIASGESIQSEGYSKGRGGQGQLQTKKVRVTLPGAVFLLGGFSIMGWSGTFFMDAAAALSISRTIVFCDRYQARDGNHMLCTKSVGWRGGENDAPRKLRKLLYYSLQVICAHSVDGTSR